MKSCLLDKNIFLDIVLKRPHFEAIESIVLTRYENWFISTHTIATSTYLLRKEGWTLGDLELSASVYSYLEISINSIVDTFGIAFNLDDFEDVVEVLTSKTNNIPLITRDKKLAQRYSNYTEIVFVK